MFGGSMVAAVTPMTAGGEIDFPAWERLLQFHAEQNTDAIVVGGTTGESPTVDAAELDELVRRAVRTLRGRMPVIAGAGTNSTRRTAQRAQELAGAGADALLVVTPYYNKPTQEGLFEHFRAVAAAVSAPVILYNVPSRTGVDLQAATVARLAREPHIAGIKEATGSVERGREILASVSQGFALISGDDATAHELMDIGATGVISVTANVAPRLMHELCVAARERHEARTHEIDSKLRNLHSALFVESNPIPVKWALQAMGLIAGGIRLPLTPLAARYHDQVRAALRSSGVMN
ncbi:MAG TPA: 4-hydroxy-tetrahydrodipicolinate synthase [Steroidobacteraceae bacterium]|jgi:4-hydroxy-tetrahydrodipicolinate synthase|nr:4-hydroxy-tetrahydrodipicolinate synthase [Steroidobacteraceae bacterium]